MRKVTLWIVLLMLAALSPVEVIHAQETLDFPAPTGPYVVGRVTYHMADDSRGDVYSDAPDDIREVMVTIYYPAEPDASAVPAPYMETPLRDAIVEVMGIPGEVLDNVHPHAYELAPAIQERFPVIIFSHGGGVNSIFYTAMLEEISSQGYVVVSITHPYEAAVIVFPDGRQVASTDVGVDFYVDMWGLNEAQQQALQNVPGSQRLMVLQTVLPEEKMNAGLDQYYTFVIGLHTQDVLFVLDELIGLNDSDPILAGRLDFERLGIFGHSLGGATAATVMYMDSRFKAGINLDGSLFSAKDYTLNQPFMLILSDNKLLAAQDPSEASLSTIKDHCDEMSAFYERLSPGYFLTLSGVTHNGLISDLTLAQTAFPQYLSGLTEGIEPVRAVETISTYVWTFFDQYLKGDTTLDGLAADFPEMQAGPEACMP
jgi:predicted dienelactone hydrolase